VALRLHGGAYPVALAAPLHDPGRHGAYFPGPAVTS
jgi:hypothetical protein